MALKKIPFAKRIRYLLEYAISWLFFKLLSALPLKISAKFAAQLSLFIGPKLSVNKLAKNNLSSAMPNLKQGKIDQIIKDMWCNLGMIVGEFPHIGKIDPKNIGKYIKFSKESLKNLEQIKKLNQGGIIFSGHIGNWEIGPKSLISQGLKVKTLYRPLNNPYVEDLTAKASRVELIKKDSSGSREIINSVKNGEYVIILADQKTTEGIPVKFFHKEATTTTSIARIAQKYNIPIIPARVIRLNKEFKFEIEVGKPIKITENAKNFDVIKYNAIINQTIEKWIKEYPEQWFWVHDRWKV